MPSWVGDMVMAQSLLRTLKQQHREIIIDVLVPAWSCELFKHMPEVHAIIGHELQHGQLAWQERKAWGQKLKTAKYQQAIILPGSWKSALIPFWAQIPQRTGYLGEFRYILLNDIRAINKLELRRTVDQFVALGLPKTAPRQLHLPRPQLSPGNIARSLTKLGLSRCNKKLLVLCPGAEYGLAKRWPAEYYAIVAKKSIALGWQVWVVGSNKDTVIGARIKALCGDHPACINLCGQTGLSDAVNILSLADAVVCNDSGLMHVAAALERLVIAIYGSSSPSITPPLGQNNKILWHGQPCSPCLQRTCRYGHYLCLRHIRPEQVLDFLC
jgi:heptosyltransferase II